jgi:hypothetical protein
MVRSCTCLVCCTHADVLHGPLMHVSCMVRSCTTRSQISMFCFARARSRKCAARYHDACCDTSSIDLFVAGRWWSRKWAAFRRILKGAISTASSMLSRRGPKLALIDLAKESRSENWTGGGRGGKTLKYASVLRDASWLYIRCTKVYRCLHMIVGVVGAVDAHLASNHVE